ncbi:MAG: CPBP family intramembrane metalloprotease [Planctomycetes bacterium]|nr:CPBP family intramembrane metalloprotease [Planctomycetota bacterium]
MAEPLALESSHVPPARPPRVWPVFVDVALALLGSIVTSAIVITVALLVMGGDLTEPQEGLTRLASSFLGVLLLLAPGQVTFLAAAIAPALLSARGFALRLALRRPAVPFGPVLLLVVGTLGVQGLIQLGSPLLGEPSDGVRRLMEILTSTSGVEAVLVALGMSLIPGICEELFFRGYVQSRLMERFGPARGILLASVAFAAAHVDPQHAIAVFPLGLWIGAIAHVTRSTWPAIAAHVLNNLVGIAQVNLGDAERVFIPPDDPLKLGSFGVAALAGIAGLLLARRAHARSPAPASVR